MVYFVMRRYNQVSLARFDRFDIQGVIIMGAAWQLQDAKNNFSRLIKLAVEGKAQVVTVHGKPTAVIVSTREYEKLTRPSIGKLSKSLLCPDIAGDDLEFPRDRNTGRKIAL